MPAPPVAPRWCWSGSPKDVAACADWRADTCPAIAGRCDDDSAGCAAGLVPSTSKPGTCRVPGAAWDCPPGFVTQGSPSGAAPPLCVPDPLACPDDAYGDEPGKTANVYVDGQAAPGGDGSRNKPVRTLYDAWQKVPNGGTIAITDGVYTGYLTMNRLASIRGRCAAKVRIDSPADTPAIALIAPGTGSVVQISGVTLSGISAGMATVAPAAIEMTGVYIHKARSAAISIDHPSAVFTLRDSVINSTRDLGGPGGYGIQIVKAKSVRLERVRLSDNRDHGILAKAPNLKLRVDGLRVDGTRARASDGTEGVGVGLYGTDNCRLVDVSVLDNRTAGLRVATPGTKATVISLHAGHTLADPATSQLGHGVEVSASGDLTLVGALVDHNIAFGVNNFGNPTARIVGALLAHNQPTGKDKQYGFGLVALIGSRVDLVASHVLANYHVGVGAGGVGTLLRISDTVIQDTRRHALGTTIPTAMHAYASAEVELRRVRLSGTPGWGVEALGAGTRVRAWELLIDNTKHDPHEADHGRGMELAHGAAVAVHGGRITGTAEIGARLDGLHNRARLVGVLIDQTMPDPNDGIWGIGAAADGGARLDLLGSRLVANRHTGVLANHSPSHAEVIGCLVTDTTPTALASSVPEKREASHFGIGIGAVNGGSIGVVSSLLARNHTAGILAVASKAKVIGSLTLDTRGAEFWSTGTLDKTSLGDGIALIRADGSSVRDTATVGNLRSGLLVDGGEDIELERLVSSDNLFGIARQGQTKALLSDAASWANTQANLADELGLATPSAPKVVVSAIKR